VSNMETLRFTVECISKEQARILLVTRLVYEVRVRAGDVTVYVVPDMDGYRVDGYNVGDDGECALEVAISACVARAGRDFDVYYDVDTERAGLEVLQPLMFKFGDVEVEYGGTKCYVVKYGDFVSYARTLKEAICCAKFARAVIRPKESD